MKKWLRSYLSKDDVHKISEAVKKAEEKTSGQIVPVIVQRSSAIGHVPLTLTFIFLIAALFVEFPWKDILFITPWIYFWPVVAIAFFLLSHLIGRLKFVQRILVPNHDEASQVYQRAQLEFFLNHVGETRKATGILVFVSVMERRAVILADKGLSEKIKPEIWQALVDRLTLRLKKGEWATGFQDCILECGYILSTHFPMTGVAQNELRNDLVIKD